MRSDISAGCYNTYVTERSSTLTWPHRPISQAAINKIKISLFNHEILNIPRAIWDQTSQYDFLFLISWILHDVFSWMKTRMYHEQRTFGYFLPCYGIVKNTDMYHVGMPTSIAEGVDEAPNILCQLNFLNQSWHLWWHFQEHSSPKFLGHSLRKLLLSYSQQAPRFGQYLCQTATGMIVSSPE